MICILQEHYGMDLQEAMDYVGEMCRMTMENFKENAKRLPSFGSAEVDADVAAYVKALQDWMVGQPSLEFHEQAVLWRRGS